MFLRRALSGVCAAAGLVLAGAAVPAHAVEPAESASAVRTAALDPGATQSADLSVGTLNAGLTSESDGQTLTDLQTGDDERATELAKTVEQTRPDVLVLTGIDVDSDGATVDALRDNYLAASGGPDYHYTYAPATNAGIDSGADLDGDGTIGGAGDALGAGDFPGQNSMAVLSVHPIDTNAARSFSKLAWSDVPGNHLEESDFPKNVREDVPLFSTSLWDVPVDVGSSTVHVVAASLSPASGAGADTVRNRDQVRLLRDYVEGQSKLSSVEDDQGRSGPLSADTHAVIAGDLGVDVSSDAKSAKSVKSLLRTEGAEQEDTTSDDWLARLDRLIKNGEAATRVGSSSARLDYVIGAGDLQSLEPETTDAVTSGDELHRMVVTGFDF